MNLSVRGTVNEEPVRFSFNTVTGEILFQGPTGPRLRGHFSSTRSIWLEDAGLSWNNHLIALSADDDEGRATARQIVDAILSAQVRPPSADPLAHDAAVLASSAFRWAQAVSVIAWIIAAIAVIGGIVLATVQVCDFGSDCGDNPYTGVGIAGALVGVFQAMVVTMLAKYVMAQLAANDRSGG